MNRPLARCKFLPTLCLWLLCTGGVLAEAQLAPLGKLDQAYMQQQTEAIEEIATRRLGRRLQGNYADISILQSLLDRQLIKTDDDAGLQAMGIVLGNALAQDYQLEWVVYVDQRGRSRALRIGPDQQCLFPSTMISRRAKAGVEVNVEALYEKATRTIERVRSSGLKPY